MSGEKVDRAKDEKAWVVWQKWRMIDFSEAGQGVTSWGNWWTLKDSSSQKIGEVTILIGYFTNFIEIQRNRNCDRSRSISMTYEISWNTFAHSFSSKKCFAQCWAIIKIRFKFWEITNFDNDLLGISLMISIHKNRHLLWIVCGIVEFVGQTGSVFESYPCHRHYRSLACGRKCFLQMSICSEFVVPKIGNK